MTEHEHEKPLFWIGSSLNDLTDCPDEVQNLLSIGRNVAASRQTQSRCMASVVLGCWGAGALEIVNDFDGNAYRAVYTVRFAKAVYALHVFQKKSRKGIATPKHDIELVKARLKRAEAHYAAWIAETQRKTP